MLPVSKILCSTDFSKASFEALEVAVELSQHFSAKLFVIHVVNPVPIVTPSPDAATFDVAAYQDELESNSREKLSQVVEEKVGDEVEAEKSIVQGDPAAGIVEFADKNNIDLLVIASHGRTGWKRLLSGSVATKVLKLAHCPTLVIKTGRKPAG